MIFFSLTHNVLQICDVADLVAVSFILPLIFIRSRMFHLPLNPSYSQMCCYGLVLFKSDYLENTTHIYMEFSMNIY